MPRRWSVLRLAAQALLVSALAVLLSVQAFSMFRPAPEMVLGPLLDDLPTDLDGTVWFYGWMDRAVSQGLPILSPDWVRFPLGQNLGGNFPNRVDAWMALPFMHFLPFPDGFNLFVVCIPVFNTLAGWVFFRTLTDRWWLALSAAMLFGFQRYSFYELAGGRPVSALLFTLPLFLAAWWHALRTPRLALALAWAVVAGAFAALVACSYAPWTVWAGALAVGCAVVRVLAPAGGAADAGSSEAGGARGRDGRRGGWRFQERARPVAIAIVALTTAILLAASYLHELLVLRVEGGQGGNPLPFWDLRVWTETLTALTHQAPGVRSAAPFSAVNENEVALDALWNGSARGADRAALPGGTWAVVVAAVVLGGWEARFWALAGVLCWVSLGGLHPAAMLTRSPAWLQAVGPWIPSPLAAFARVAPDAVEHLRAYRGAPIATLALLAAIVSAWAPFSRKAARWTTHWPRAAWIPRAAGAIVILALGARAASNAVTIDAPRVPRTPWHPSPFYAQLAASPDSGAIIELPVGFGHAFGPVQLLHQHARSEPAMDTLGQVGRQPQLWLRPFEALGAAGGPALDPALLDAARADGFGWVMLHSSAYKRLKFLGRPLDAGVAKAWLSDALGEPVFEDREIVVYRL